MRKGKERKKFEFGSVGLRPHTSKFKLLLASQILEAIMNIPVGVTATIGDRVRQSSDTLSALSIAIFGTLLPDLEIRTSSASDNAATAAAELEKVKAGFDKMLDALVTASNGTTASYHDLVQMHGDYEQRIKMITALGHSSSITLAILVQLYRIQKTQIERRMLITEGLQCHIWERIQSVHVASM